jgi:cytochrome P450
MTSFLAAYNVSLPNSGLITILSIIFLLIARLTYNYTRLHHIPGPLLAGSTNLWRAYHQYRGNLRHTIIALHDQFGPVVRYGVNMVSIRDSRAVQQIYASPRKGFTIHDSYGVILGIDKDGREVESMVTIRDEGKHGQMRRAVANAFTPTAVAEMEGIIEESVVDLLDVLSAAAEKEREVDIARMLLWYSLDNAGRMTFGDDAGCLRTDADAQGAGKMIHARFTHWGTWAALPELERLLYRNSLSLRMRNSQPAEFARKAAARLADRVAKPWVSSQPDLLNSFIEAGKKHPDVLTAQGTMGVIMSTISGAADTTASTLVGILYYLVTHPEALSKLEHELTNASVTLPIPKYTETRHLPYLDSVVKESMRLFSVMNWPMERRVPAGGMSFGDHYFPENTSVGVMPAALHMDRSVFGEDVKEFRPERWLSGDAERTRRMEASFLGFSRGKRVCLGQNIAVLQLKKVVPALVLKFDIELADDTQTLDADYSPAVVMAKPLFIKLAQKPSV